MNNVTVLSSGASEQQYPKMRIFPHIFVNMSNNQFFEHVSRCKFLGVINNSKLSWIDQKNLVSNQVSKLCGSLYSESMSQPKFYEKIYMALI